LFFGEVVRKTSDSPSGKDSSFGEMYLAFRLRATFFASGACSGNEVIRVDILFFKEDAKFFICLFWIFG